MSGRQILGLIALAVCGVLLYQVIRSDDGPNGEDVAAAIGATDCSSSGYELTNRLDGSKETIFECALNGKERCVTMDGGIAHDDTATVRLLFTDTLSGGKPACV